MEKSSILLIYTGGTIGMQTDAETGSLRPVNFSHFINEVPELQKSRYHITTHAFSPPIDSANAGPQLWIQLATLIEANYHLYDGFVILHGTDTMAYTASALSFMLENLSKPIIFTGAQLPLGALRTDGKENLVTSIEIAGEKKDGLAVVPEVCIYFENKLLRGNRSTKYSAEHFNAFRSVNYPALAEVGLHIRYNYPAINYPLSNNPLIVHKNLDTRIGLLKLFPGIPREFVEAITQSPSMRALILETFGSGNAMTESWFLALIEKLIKKDVLVVNVSQCFGGTVDMKRYQTSMMLEKIGVISGYDSTTEAMVTKLMYLLGKYTSNEAIIQQLHRSIRGEISLSEEVAHE
ncbi:MAG: type I asparaginase [Bacteroidales bacterium]|nr:type I asparaginase [Bacteroidales bacterium]HPO64780.1 type I asparaginase [Bacteroidales bacterium]